MVRRRCICGRTDLADRCTLVGAASCVCGCVDVAFCVYPAICGEASDEECGEDECRQSDWKRRNQEINNLEAQGVVKLSGMEWSARSADDSKIAAGEKVLVQSIDGVKLIVTKSTQA